MGLNSLRVYFDAYVAIYLVEEHPTFAPMIETRLKSIFFCQDFLEMSHELTG